METWYLMDQYEAATEIFLLYLSVYPSVTYFSSKKRIVFKYI